MPGPNGGTPPTLEQQLDERVVGGVNDFDYGGNPSYTPLETRENDIVLSTQEMLLRIPGEPVYINDVPYGINVDDIRLLDVVSYLRTAGHNKGVHEPRMLEVSLGNSLFPHIDAGESKPDPVGFDHKTGTLHVVIPAEVEKSTLDTAWLARKVGSAANRDLQIALDQIAFVRAEMAKGSFAKLAALATSFVAVGEGIGLKLASDDTLVTIGKGGMLAIIAGAFTYGFKEMADPDVRRGANPDKAFRKAYEKSAEGLYGVQIEYEEPIISLVPLEEKPAEAPFEAQ